MSRKTPTYHRHNVHGVRSPFPALKSRVIKSFSLTFENARYLEAVPKGQKSDVINRALAYYRAGGRAVEEKDDQIAHLSKALAEAYEKIDAKGGVESQKVSIVYVLTYPFQLLKQRLGRR